MALALVLCLAAIPGCSQAAESLESAPTIVGSDAEADEAQPEVPVVHPATTVFTDVTVASGVAFQHQAVADETVPMGGGVVVLDFDGDGRDDLYASNSVGPNALYRNDGDVTFTDVAQSAGVDDPEGRGNGGCSADYDNDGDIDLYVTNYGSSKLFRNGGEGTFDDVTIPSNLGERHRFFRSTGCAWGDYDRDGHVDLIVVRHMAEHSPVMLEEKDFLPALQPMVLHHNGGDGSFTEVTALLGDTSRPQDVGQGNLWGAGFQPGWVDFDNDGDLDLYVVNDFGPEIEANLLWRNDGPAPEGAWTFTDISFEARAGVQMFGMALAVADYDLDGYLDLFVTDIRGNTLLKNDRGLRFADVAAKAGVDSKMIGRKARVNWGAVFFDYDNDGDEDLYVVSGFLSGDAAAANAVEQENLLFRNGRDGTFEDVSSQSGAADPGVGRGAVYLDFNDDGCLDLFVANLGQTARLFRNRCDTGNNWIAVNPVGTRSNRDGIGARITVIAGGVSQIREISGGSSQMGQNMLAAHFGLGQADVVDYVLIRWPSGAVQTVAGVAANQRLTVVEPE